ncbi:MAG: ribose 5-phosphate isomerase B [Acidobacteria bacterium]|nr:ribose 5-phosphate isomerase B [Acidobacteriota bacterium]
MKIAVGADHAGLELKDHLRRYLEQQGHAVHDFGTHSPESTDYPDYAERVGRAVAGGEADRGLLVCGTGIGMAIAANKIPGIRAANCFEPYTAELAREHNDANVLTLAGRILAPPYAEATLQAFLDTDFAGGRHQRRIDKMSALDGSPAARP